MVTTQPIVGVYATLTNRPGELERASRAIAEKRVNVDAVTLETVGSTAFVRFYCRTPRDAIHALASAGIEAFESAAIVASLPNRPGELSRACAEIAAAGINVESVATTADGRLVFRTSDNERADAVLRKI